MSGYGALARFFFSTMSINKVYLRLLKMCLSVGFFSCCREVGKETGDKALFLYCLENKVPADQNVKLSCKNECIKADESP